MRESIDVGPTPADEPCEQLGPNYDSAKARRECRAYIAQLRRVYGEEVGSARYRVTSNSHDFGTYHEVEVTYSDSDEEGEEYAYRVESGCEQWDAEALAELARGDG